MLGAGRSFILAGVVAASPVIAASGMGASGITCGSTDDREDKGATPNEGAVCRQLCKCISCRSVMLPSVLGRLAAVGGRVRYSTIRGQVAGDDHLSIRQG
jgi:hypothetical protein